jgi:integration host factor subunit beta
MKRSRAMVVRSELIDRICARQPHLSREDVSIVVSVILNGIAEHLRKGGRFEARGFGTFATRFRRTRIARNPKTGERVEVPPRRVPRFSPSQALLGKKGRRSQTPPR